MVRFHCPVKIPDAYASSHKVGVIADVLIENRVDDVLEVGCHNVPAKRSESESGYASGGR